MPTFTTPDPLSVTIELGVVGDIRITATDRQDTVVEVRPHDVSRSADVKVAEQTRVELIEGHLFVKAPRHWRQFSFMSNGGAVEVTIGLPTGSHIDADLAMGRLHAEGALGTCRVKTGMGNVRLDRVASLDLHTGYGDLTIDRVDGDADVHTGSGSIRVGDVAGTATIKNSNGGTSVHTVEGDLRVKSANGEILVGTAGSSVSAKTACGGIRVDEVVRGQIGLETAAGDLEIGIREGTAAWLDVSSRHGNVRNSLESTGAPISGHQTVEVTARTPYGDIVIGRSPA